MSSASQWAQCYTCSARGHGRWCRVEAHVRQDREGNGGMWCSSSSLLLTYYPPCSEHGITFHTNRQQVATSDSSRRRNTVPGLCYLPARKSHHRRLSQPAALPLKLKVWCPKCQLMRSEYTGVRGWRRPRAKSKLADTAKAHLPRPRPTPFPFPRHVPAARGASDRSGST